MSTNSQSLEDIVYKLSETQKRNRPGAIVFLGAGASFTAGIPLASNIIEAIGETFKEKPSVQRYFKHLDGINTGKPEEEKEKVNYYKLMQCLDADEIKELFQKYVRDAKLNVAHVYLASMIKNGYVDYVVTVNFDNLMQRALALYGIFPSVHDVTTLKEKVTDTIDRPAVIHVHGQYNGNWQLNKVGELGKVKEMLENTFAKISQNRTWIVVGYSGEDPVFETIFSSTKFDKNLYWVCYKEQAPSQLVQDSLINKTEYNASCVNGYDADTFFMKLHNSLKIEEPHIYTNPFLMLETYLEKMVDITGEEFSGVNERLRISRERVKVAIGLYNTNEVAQFPAGKKFQTGIEKDNYKLKLSEIVSAKNFNDLDALYGDIKAMGLEKELKLNISDAYFSWGYELGEAEKHAAAIEKYKTVIALNDSYDLAYNNIAVMYDRMKLYKEAIPFYEKALQLNSDISTIYLDYGNALYNTGAFNDAIVQYETGLKREPRNKELYLSYGNALAELGLNQDAEKKYREILKIDPLYASAYNGLGNVLNKDGRKAEALSLLQKGESIKEGSCLYNLACGYSLSGENQLCFASLEKLLKNEKLYNEDIARQVIESDPDFIPVKNDPEFKKLLDTYKPA